MNVERTPVSRSRATEGLIVALALALAFLGLSLLRVIGDMNSAMMNGQVRIAPIEQSIWEMRLGWRLAGFGGSLVLVHLALGAAVWSMAWLSHRAWPTSRNSQRVWACLWMVLAAVWILAANATWFPSSSLGNPYAAFAQSSIAGISPLVMITIVLLMGAVATVASFVWQCRRRIRLPKPSITAPVAVVFSSVLLVSLRPGVDDPTSVATTAPNVILIGLDSVRADVGTSGYSTPALGAFLRDATVFSDTMTPLARTFAAWISILTGRHPHTTGATVNLLPRELLAADETLAKLLQSSGYRTIYASDEVRFSNIDESYGFDMIVGPRMGSADFLIEFFGDTPLSNLLVNTRLGDTLFPELHGNRAAKVLYDPDTFIRDLDRSLWFDSPTFLAVHLTLPHWPYTWAASAPRARGSVGPTLYPDQYMSAVERVDQQFADLMDLLEQKGALTNAIVVLLSDHGESLGEASLLSDRDGRLPRLFGKTSLYGHGTHVFSKDQYQVLLAFRGYGSTPLPTTEGKSVLVPASLEDIAPTLVAALGLESQEVFDGRSLLAHMRDRSGPAAAAPRIRFLETEFNPPGVAIEQPMTPSALARASTSYRIDAVTDRVEVRPEEMGRILDSRQYAAVLDDHWIGAVPTVDLKGQHLVYLGPGSETPVWLDKPPSANGPPIQQQLWSALKARFASVAARPVVALSPDQW